MLCLALTMALGTSIEARPRPVRGAVSKPRSFKMQLPFPCGTWVRVNCTYGPGCSPAHKRTRARYSTNDHYALDLTRAEHGSGFNKSIVAVADGVVRYAGWTRGGWKPYGKIVYIEHSYRDGKGHTYQSLYAHLHTVTVKRGQRVKAGTEIGTLGGSSKRRLGHFGSHLHFALYRDAGARLGGGRAVVPEPLGSFEDLNRGMAMQACGTPDRRVAYVRSGSRPAFGGLMPSKRRPKRQRRARRK
jgi:murein DD-endopeptidase MepM/ murein hydrolase activator NlpD